MDNGKETWNMQLNLIPAAFIDDIKVSLSPALFIHS